MTRFRRSGKGWHTPASLNAYMDEIEAWDPTKRKADGTLGNLEHSNRVSDHNPDDNQVVRACDAGESDDAQGDALFEALRQSQDPRIKYAIHDGKFFSSYAKGTRKAWEVATYTGPNPHLTHNHLSVLAGFDGEGKRWNLKLPGVIPPKPPTPPTPPATATDWTDEIIMALPTLKEGNSGTDVKRAQGLLTANGQTTSIDGAFGPSTESAVKKFQTAQKLSADGVVGPNTWTKLLGE